MSITTIKPRPDLPCNACSDAAVAVLGNNSVVEVEQDGYAAALCRPHAAVLLGEERLAAVLAPPKKRKERVHA